MCWLLNVPATGYCISGTICSDKFTCCHTEIEVADPTFYLTQSQYTDTGLTSPSADPITPGAWQGSRVATGVPIFESLEKIPSQAGFEPGIFRTRGGRLTARPTRQSPLADCLVGLVVKVSAWRAEDPGFESRLR